MPENLGALLRRLCMLRGISGQEQQVAKAIRGSLRETRPDILRVDRLGNLFATRRGNGSAPSLMLVAHMDEVGAIVSEVCPNGLLRFKTVGCVNASTLPSTRVRVGDAAGTFTAPPAHTSRGGISPDDVFVDIGAQSDEEVFSMGVNLASQITYDAPFTQLSENRFCSRTIDDRIGCAILVKLFETLGFTPDGDVTVAFSVREETSMTGAEALAEQVKPDWIIAVDTVPVKKIGAGGRSIDIGKGPVIQLGEGAMQAFVANFAPPPVKDAPLRAAREAGIPYQLCAEVGDWTTDGAALHRGNGGTPCGYVSIPRRNAHSASEVFDIRDAIYALDLLVTLITDMRHVNLDFVGE